MSKRSKENKPEPKVGDNITEPLSKQEIAEREAEAERDNPKSEEPGIPATTQPADTSQSDSPTTDPNTSPPSSSTLFKKKASKKPSQIEEELDNAAILDLLSEQESEKTLMLSIEEIAKRHKLIAKQNGYTAINSNLQAIETVIGELRKKLQNTDYLVKKAKTV